MSYQVLARKWRPRNFREMVGQEHVLRALVNALDNDRLHHAYLFAGTRGVGKTTIARILAKSLNCEAGVSSQPCGECSACREIDEGRFVDLIEVDAASRTRVDETRELLENVQYAPTRGRYKVYLIDEVHMFSNHSFNALLKTLEEPPPHVKFLLATTDPQRLPVTILSRCLQFNLKCLPLPRIREYLQGLVAQEGVTAEAGALQELARAADGSMRDALSLLDQAIAYGGGKVLEADVRSMLGTIERRHLYAVLRALARHDAEKLLVQVAEFSEQAPDYEAFLAELLSLLQRVAVAQVVAGGVDAAFGDAAEVAELADLLPLEDVQLYYQIGMMGRRDLPLAPDPKGGLEMILLRMLAFRPVPAAAGVATPPVPQHAKAAPVQPTAEAVATDRSAASKAGDSAAVGTDASWEAMIQAMELKGMLRQLAENCSLVRREGQQVRLALDPAHGHLQSAQLEQRLQQALSQYSGVSVQLEIVSEQAAEETPARRRARLTEARQQAAEAAIAGDEHVKAFQDAFNAQVRPESVRPRD
jgi:DNA polymerase-3 subunit gamma/tau